MCFFPHIEQLRRLPHQLDTVFPWLAHYLPKRNLSCPELFRIMLSLFFFFFFLSLHLWIWGRYGDRLDTVSFQLSEQSFPISGAFVQLCKSGAYLWNWFETHFLGKLCNKPVHPDWLIFHCIVILKQNTRRYFWASPDSIWHSSSSTYLPCP